ncbi:hypothetical protein [Asticcacaulis biprosthecium]|uniref:hypothetical protein n=1 Tax=Asticcacaulis biprosthecium TaxID=76891 RepID=UPI00058C2C90|nr:hypothetical protein [Asticcacaulis biprosthecium]
MSRWVLPNRPGLRADVGDGADNPLARIVKYVPTEVVAAYTALFTILATFNLEAVTAQRAVTGLIALFLVVTIIYVLREAPKGSVQQAHLVVSPISFLAWAYPISSALLGDWFIPLVSFGAQAVIVALAILISPREAK